MEEKNKREEIQSRREFFKKAAKAALPVVGAAILSNFPYFARATDSNNGYYCRSCESDCTNGCAGGCRRSCDTSCALGCRGASQYYYGGDCDGCRVMCGGCQGFCSGVCQGSCYGSSYKV